METITVLQNWVSIYVHNAESVGESRSLFPSCDYNDGISSFQEVPALAEVDTELYTNIDVLQPIGLRSIYKNLHFNVNKMLKVNHILRKFNFNFSQENLKKKMHNKMLYQDSREAEFLWRDEPDALLVGTW